MTRPDDPSQPPPPPLTPPPHQPYVPPYAVPVAQQTNGMAIASLVTSIVGMCVPLLGILGLVLGIFALNRTRDPRVGGKGLAIAGIVVGAVSILAMIMQIAILLPSLNRARETANRVKCANNLRQIGLGLKLYANENRGEFPPRLEDVLRTQDISHTVFVCPSCSDTPVPGATIDERVAKLSSGGHLSYIYVPGHTDVVGAETILAYEPLTNHDNDGCNVLFGDAHVEFYTRAQAQRAGLVPQAPR